MCFSHSKNLVVVPVHKKLDQLVEEVVGHTENLSKRFPIRFVKLLNMTNASNYREPFKKVSDLSNFWIWPMLPMQLTSVAFAANSLKVGTGLQQEEEDTGYCKRWFKDFDVVNFLHKISRRTCEDWKSIMKCNPFHKFFDARIAESADCSSLSFIFVCWHSILYICWHSRTSFMWRTFTISAIISTALIWTTCESLSDHLGTTWTCVLFKNCYATYMAWWINQW